MAQDVVAVYPGTFDPMTLGHEDVVRRACQLFGRLIVAVAAGHHKKSLFTMQERIDMAREALRAYPTVTVEGFSWLVRDFVVARGGKAMVRGVRAVTDFDYEFQLAGMNRHLMPDVETVLCRAPSPNRRVSLSAAIDSSTRSRLRSGSPMPMNTMFVRRLPSAASRRAAWRAWSTISAVSRSRPKPSSPVAQNGQPTAHPAWLEMHSVCRSRDAPRAG